MDKKTINKLKRSIVLNSMIIICEVIGLILCFMDNKDFTLLMLIENSNILIILSSILLIIANIKSLKQNKNVFKVFTIVRYYCVTYLLSTLLLYLVLFTKSYMSLEYGILLHIICPVLVIISYLVFEKREKVNNKHIFFSWIFSCLMLVLLGIINKSMFDSFINVWKNTPLIIFTIVILMLIISILFRLANNYYLKLEKKWIKPRHKIVIALVYPIISLLVKIKYGCKIKKTSDKRQMVILMNHQTAFDQFLVSLSLKRPIYYIASEDLFSNGLLSRIIEFLVAPIPIKKSMTDLVAVKNSLRICKEGGTICLSPEGNRTYSGKTVNMKQSIVSFVRKLGLPVAIYIIKGGYGVHPRWSDKTRKGYMTSGIEKIIEKDEYSKLTDDEFFELIKSSLFVDETTNEERSESEVRAEYLERAYYVCPNCGLSTFYSKGNVVSCKNCNLQMTYTENKKLVGENSPFANTVEWMDYQENYIRNLDLESLKEEIYHDEIIFKKVIPYKHKVLIDKKATLYLYNNRVEVKAKNKIYIFDFPTIHAMACAGKNKLNIYYGEEIYQVKGDKRYNPVKYMNIYYHFMHKYKGEKNDEFLGL